jgi:aspartate carbamoyltransferase
MGGNVITFNSDTSSVKKGESFEDTIKTLANYGDIMVIRHPQKGIINNISKQINIPIINGGDGDGEHPTQALLDLYTIYKSFPSLADLNILFVGDIRYSRTVRSLVDLFGLYPRNKIYFLPYYNRYPELDMLYDIASKTIQIPDSIIIDRYQISDIDLSEIHVVYSTRMQNERTDEKEEPDIIINKEFMSKLNKNAIVMHPLPRNNEIHPEVDSDPRCIYFKQMEYGVNIRMGLLYNLLYS